MNNFKVGDRLFVDIKRIGINGEGIAFYNKLAIFIEGALPKENVLVEITKATPKYAEAKIVEIKKVSPERKNVLCPYYTKCGGCNMMHLEYKASLKAKKDILIEAINRYSNINPRKFEIRETIGSNEEMGYRFKATLPLRQGEHGVVFGLYAPNSEKFIRIKECLIHNKLINEIATGLCNALDLAGINAYGPKNKTGYARFAIIRASSLNGDSQVTLIFAKKPDNLEKLSQLVLSIPHVKSLYYSINAEEENVEFYGEDVIYLAGEKYIYDQLDKYKYQLLPNSFFQLNTHQANVLFSEVKKIAKLKNTDTVLDAFCGVGAIGIYLADQVKEVIGVEVNKEAILNAKANIEINKLDNVRFIEGNASKILPYLNKNNEIDVLVVDPPRSGLDDEFLKAILKANIKKIIYVSCNPATLAKNLSVLEDKYNVNLMQPVDMFPNTAHVETVCSLVKK